jgi:hypothetical protein
MAGRNIDKLNTSTLGDYLLVTKWRPKAEAFEALYFEGFKEKLSFSHKLDDLELLYNQSIFPKDTARRYSKELDEPLGEYVDEFTPLFWSAGLIVHPYLAPHTRRYQRNFYLSSNRHLWPCSFFFYSDTNFLSSMESYDHFSKGQAYTGIELNVYKKIAHGLVVTSFSLFSAHVCGYQQLPWMVNLAGLPVWSQSASANDSIASFGITNTHNPAVQQAEDMLLVTYLTPSIFTNTFNFIIRSLFTTKVRMFFPIDLVDRVVVIPCNCPYYGADVLNEEKYTHLTDRDSELTIGPQVFVSDHEKKKGLVKSGYDSTGAALDNDEIEFEEDNNKRSLHTKRVEDVKTSTQPSCLSANPITSIYSGVSTIFTGTKRENSSKAASNIPPSSSSSSKSTDPIPSAPSTAQRNHTIPPQPAETTPTPTNPTPNNRNQRFTGEYYFQPKSQHPNSNMWIVCAYKTCYIGMCCTKSSYLEEFDAPDCRWRSSEQNKSYDILSRFVCDASEQSWVIVTGTKDDYPTLEKFINLRLYHISIAEKVDRSNNGKVYEVLVKDDARHLQLSYGYDIRRRKQVDVTLLAPSAPPSLPSVPITKTFNTSYFA